MRPFLISLLIAALGGSEEPPPVHTARVQEILVQVRPHLVELTGLPWPGKLTAERTDRAGLEALLLTEFRAEVAAHHPKRSASAQEYLARVLARSFARVLRAKYGLDTKKIHVAPGALAGLEEGADPDRVLVHLVAHEAVHALDDAAHDLAKLTRSAPDPEARRALRMVIEGRAEHYGILVAARLGASEESMSALMRGRDPTERLVRSAGRRFIAALEKRDPGLCRKVLLSPPRTTTLVFHPERYGKDPEAPDLDSHLAAALESGVATPLSELLLRSRFEERLGVAEVTNTFAGYVAGAAREVRGRSRLSIVFATDERQAAAFLTGLLKFEGREEKGDGARGKIVAPDGRQYAWAAARRGRYVAEGYVPMGQDAAKLVDRVLDSAVKR